MDKYIITIPVKGNISLLHCDVGDSMSLKALQDAVEGYIEPTRTSLPPAVTEDPDVELVMLVNEEGKVKGLPVNQRATQIAWWDIIVGNVILLGVKGEDFVGLTKSAAESIREEIRRLTW